MDTTITKVYIANKALAKIGAALINTAASGYVAPFNDGSSNGNLVAAVYDQLRDEFLEENPWSFAIKTILAVPLNPTAWATSTVYTVNQFVTINNLIYICLIQHTSGVFATDLAAGDWQLQTGAVPIVGTIPDFGDGVKFVFQIPSDFLSLYLVSIPNAQLRIETLIPPFVSANTVVLLSDQANLAIKYVFNNDNPGTYTAKAADALAWRVALELCFKISEAAQFVAQVEKAYQKALASAMTSDSNMNSPDFSRTDEWFFARLGGSGVVSGLPNNMIGFFPDPYANNF